jgi:hypothetical protein
MSQPSAAKRRSWIVRLMLGFGLALFVIFILALARGYFAFHDRLPGFTLDLHIDPLKPGASTSSLRVGFAREKINPDLSNPEHPIYLAGFGQNRRATAIHDDLWAIACVIDDGRSRLGIVALDAIGFFHDDVVRVRRRLAAEWKIDYAVICSTHNHSTPDLMGLWGKDFLHSGVDADYLELVRTACVKALGGAVSNLQPARLSCCQVAVDITNLVADTRKPIVFDPDIRVMHFVEPASGTTLGSIIGWADHPETPWSQNTEITADYCGYLRTALEQGVTVDDRSSFPAVAVFICTLTARLEG